MLARAPDAQQTLAARAAILDARSTGCPGPAIGACDRSARRRKVSQGFQSADDPLQLFPHARTLGYSIAEEGCCER